MLRLISLLVGVLAVLVACGTSTTTNTPSIPQEPKLLFFYTDN